MDWATTVVASRRSVLGGVELKRGADNLRVELDQYDELIYTPEQVVRDALLAVERSDPASN